MSCIVPCLHRAIMGNKSGDADANSNKGVIIIGANCLIRMVNDTAVQVSYATGTTCKAPDQGS